MAWPAFEMRHRTRSPGRLHLHHLRNDIFYTKQHGCFSETSSPEQPASNYSVVERVEIRWKFCLLVFFPISSSLLTLCCIFVPFTELRIFRRQPGPMMISSKSCLSLFPSVLLPFLFTSSFIFLLNLIVQLFICFFFSYSVCDFSSCRLVTNDRLISF